jgi:hypothetical protein
MLHALLIAGCALQNGHLACTTTSNAGKAVTLTFTESALVHSASHAYEGTLCSTPAKPLTEAKLWMPEHGHGSTRTRLAATDAGCTQVGRMVFTMAGHWEIRLKFTDGDTGVIHVAAD